MAAGRIAAALLLPALLPVGLTAAVHSAREGSSEATQLEPSPKRLRPGQPQRVDKALLTHGKQSTRRYGLRSSVPEQLETWHDSGLAAKSNVLPATILKLTETVTAEAFSAQLHALVDPEPTRFVGTKGNGVAAANIKKAFEGMGLQAEIQPLGPSPALSRFVSSSQSLAGNVLGYLRGTDRADELVIVACHYDSVNWNNLAAPAPGVDDNGSGVALMLLLAKAFTQSATRPRRSLLFVSFQAEEEGLVGSKRFAQLFAVGGEGHKRFGRPVAALVADEVAWPGKTADSRKVIFETKGRQESTNVVVDTLAHAAQQQCDGGFRDCVRGFVVNYHGFGSDHIPLLDVNVPAVLLIERDNMYHADKWGHTDQDTFRHIDPAFGAATTRLALQAVAALASPDA